MASVAPTVVTPANDRIVLYNVGWQTYANLRQNLGDKPTRLTYDGNNLEIMSPSRWHELAGRFLGTMIRAMSAELDLPIASGGSTTFQRPDVERALEPDECFWVANEAQVREKHDIDLAVDPPPDLAIEIDISPSRLKRLKIYAALRIPEIWRFDGEELRIELLQADATYHSSSTSTCFPFLPVRELVQFLMQLEHSGETATLRKFVEWVREQKFEA